MLQQNWNPANLQIVDYGNGTGRISCDPLAGAASYQLWLTPIKFLKAITKDEIIAHRNGCGSHYLATQATPNWFLSAYQYYQPGTKYAACIAAMNGTDVAYSVAFEFATPGAEPIPNNNVMGAYENCRWIDGVYVSTTPIPPTPPTTGGTPLPVKKHGHK